MGVFGTASRILGGRVGHADHLGGGQSDQPVRAATARLHAVRVVVARVVVARVGAVRVGAVRVGAVLVGAVLVGAVLVGGCGLTVTQERPTYEELDAHEKSVVQIVLAELTGFNAQVEARTKYCIKGIIDKEKINVSFEGNIFSANLGDDLIHVAPWENLDSAQQALVAEWFETSEAAAKPIYQKLFYRFLAVSQGAKQFQYEVLTARWVYGNRSLYNVERDSLRETLSYYRAVGKQAEMWTFATSACAPVIAQYTSRYTFDKKYLSEHFQELANPKAPTGYIYYICKWIELGRTESVDLTTELLWVASIPSLAHTP